MTLYKPAPAGPPASRSEARPAGGDGWGRREGSRCTDHQLLFSAGFLALGCAVLYFLYEGLMLASGGQTVGKRAMRVKVVTAEGGDISAGQAWSRAVLRQILAITPGLGLIDYLAAFGLERATLHDRVARTRVVNWG